MYRYLSARITEFYFMYNATGKEIIKCFKKWMKKYKTHVHISDNGTGLRNKTFERWL